MTIRLRFAFDVEFDSADTARAFGVSLGWVVKSATDNALALSESATPSIKRAPFEVTAGSVAEHG